MPGRQVRNWPKYHALRRKGFSKQSAARITNAGAKRRRVSTAKRPHVMTPARRAALAKAAAASQPHRIETGRHRRPVTRRRPV